VRPTQTQVPDGVAHDALRFPDPCLHSPLSAPPFPPFLDLVACFTYALLLEKKRSIKEHTIVVEKLSFITRACYVVVRDQRSPRGGHYRTPAAVGRRSPGPRAPSILRGAPRPPARRHSPRRLPRATAVATCVAAPWSWECPRVLTGAGCRLPTKPVSPRSWDRVCASLC